MKIIGITGGIGSGKSYVAKLAAEELDLLHIDTDGIARRQMAKGGATYEAVIEAFGQEYVGADGEIDRPKLSQTVFEDRDKLSLLNSITHPQVKATVDALIESAEDLFEGVIIETAILKEAGYETLCDAIWYVHAPLEDRIARLMASRGFTRDKADQVMAAQASEETFRAYATAVIENPEGIEDETLRAYLRQIYQG